VQPQPPDAADADVPPRRPPVRRARRALATAGLIVLGLAWELWLAPTGSGTLA
jgi:uncharacterized membrane protein